MNKSANLSDFLFKNKKECQQSDYMQFNLLNHIHYRWINRKKKSHLRHNRSEDHSYKKFHLFTNHQE